MTIDPEPPQRGALREYLETVASSETASDEPVFVISVAAELVGAHAQTLRNYERAGLVAPARSVGNIRLYSERDVLRMRAITLLTAELGVNLAGVELILDLRRQLRQLQAHVAALEGDLRAMRGFLLEDHRRRTADSPPPRAGLRRPPPRTHRAP